MVLNVIYGVSNGCGHTYRLSGFVSSRLCNQDNFPPPDKYTFIQKVECLRNIWKLKSKVCIWEIETEWEWQIINKGECILWNNYSNSNRERYRQTDRERETYRERERERKRDRGRERQRERQSERVGRERETEREGYIKKERESENETEK